MRTVFLPALSFVAILAACQTIEERPSETIGEADVHLANGAAVGITRLLQRGDEITISASFTGLPEGTHGVHLHTTGSCEAPDFSSAGPHLNPDDHQHGFENPQGAHLGDLPNVMIDDAGSGTVSASFKRAASEVTAQIFDNDGTAIVVHEGPDDYRTDPAGNSGSRIACGVFVKN